MKEFSDEEIRIFNDGDDAIGGQRFFALNAFDTLGQKCESSTVLGQKGFDLKYILYANIGRSCCFEICDV
jgi:hypothetical protein